MLLGSLFYVLAVSIPAIVAICSDEQLLDNGLVDCAARMIGIIAYTIITLQFVLAANIKWIVDPIGFSRVIRFHQMMAVVATLFVLFHVGLLVWSRANWNLVLNPWAGWPIQLGRAAVLLLTIILAISFGRRLLPINDADWRWFHNSLAWLILILGFVHSMAMGSSFEDLPFAVIWTAYLALAISAWARSRLNSTKKIKT